MVPVPFALVQQVCGAFDAGTCRVMGGAPCAPAPCPYLSQGPPVAPRPDQDEIDRRTFTLQGVAAACVAGVAMLGAGLAAGIGRAVGRGGGGTSTTPTLGAGPVGSTGAGSSTAPTAAATTTTTAAPGTTAATAPPTTGAPKPAGTRIGAAKDVPVGGAASFQDPSSGDPSLVVQPVAGTFEAFDAVCPHAGCIVAYSSQADRFICPCHGSEFNGRTGAVLQGPAPRGLGRISVTESGGELYVT